MALSVQNFIQLANFYNQLTTVMAAISVQKGGIAMENYVGRFFAADVLEFITQYGNTLVASKDPAVGPEVVSLVARFKEEFEKVKDLTTPTEKPIHEMTLEEFEKLMNI